MNEYLMVDVDPRVSVMFKDKHPVRAFIDINAAAEQLDELVKKAMETINFPPKPKKIYGIIKFTRREIKRMAEPFRQQFKRGGGVANITKTFGEEITYKIWYCRNGYNISVTNTDLKTVKELFIKAS